MLAEGAVIVVSILLAFAVDAWWDYRQERAREVAYLRELVVDLENTLADNAAFSRRAEPGDQAIARLVQSYYEATPPQPDSVAYWLSALKFWVTQPRLGTLQTLVSTGDLALIRSDSLRTAIPNHLTNMIAFDGFEAAGAETYQLAARDLASYIDVNQILIETLSSTARDSALEPDPLEPLPRGQPRDLPRQNLGAVVRNPEVHRILSQMLGAKQGMRFQRDLMRSATEALLERVRSVAGEVNGHRT